MSIVNYVATEMERICKSENNVFGYSIWTHHITSVVKYAKLLADKVGADDEIVEIAAYLHDYASILDSAYVKEHHIHGAREAERILTELGFEQHKIKQVKACIIAHRGSVRVSTNSLEAKCVADGDAMAHIVNVPSLLYLTYVKKGLSIDEGAIWLSKKLNRSWNKLSEEAKEIIEEDYHSAIRTLGQGTPQH